MDAAQVLGVGGPFAGIAALITALGVYLVRRRGSETGVVETTKATLGLMKEQQDALAETLRTLRSENQDLQRRLTLKDEQVETLRTEKNTLAEQVEDFREANDEMRRRLDRLEAHAGGRRGSDADHF